MCREGLGMNLLTCFNIDLYRDALCKIENDMHSDYRYVQLDDLRFILCVLSCLVVHLIVISAIVDVTQLAIASIDISPFSI